MSSQAAASAGMWVQSFFREALNADWRAVKLVTNNKQDLQFAFPLHAVTDCYSLYETVVRSGLPSDRRAVIEVRMIRELVTLQAAGDDPDEEDHRLWEPRLERNYHWRCSAKQKADVLTKHTTIAQRSQWMRDANLIRVTPKATPGGPPRPSRPRPAIAIHDFRDKIIEEALDNDWTLLLTSLST